MQCKVFSMQDEKRDKTTSKGGKRDMVGRKGRKWCQTTSDSAWCRGPTDAQSRSNFPVPFLPLVAPTAPTATKRSLVHSLALAPDAQSR